MKAAVFFFVSAIKIYQFKAKDSEIKPCPFCLENISEDFAVKNVKKMDMCAIFLLITILLILAILSVFINI